MLGVEDTPDVLELELELAVAPEEDDGAWVDPLDSVAVLLPVEEAASAFELEVEPSVLAALLSTPPTAPEAGLS